MRFIALGFLVFFLFTAMLFAQPEGKAGQQTNAGLIAFASNRDGNYEIYTMRADGSDTRNLTRNAAPDTVPVWSPDGRQIAFISLRNASSDIYVMDADGSNLHLVVSNTTSGLPVWSPDSTQIGYSAQEGGVLGVYVINSDGSNPRRIFQDASYLFITLAWSPNSRQIVLWAFRTTTDLNQPTVPMQIIVMNADGSNSQELFQKLTYGFPPHLPVWSPDSKQIAFESFEQVETPIENVVTEIYLVNADGSNIRNLSPSGTDDRHPTWSPDGNRIAFFSKRDGNSEIYVMNADGSDQRNLTQNPAEDTSPNWSPDGAQLIFESNRDGNNEIYVMNADGSDQRKLTQSAGVDVFATWQPTTAAGS